MRPRIDDSVRSLSDFHADPRYSGDLHRADMAWALHAASRGLPEQQIRDEILHARDLSKKGGPRAPAQLRATDRDQGGQHRRAAPLNALLRYGRRGVTRSPHGAGAPAVPASLRLMWCAVASLQARHPCGPLRSVTLAGCAAGGSRLRATVRVWVRRLRPKNGAG